MTGRARWLAVRIAVALAVAGVLAAPGCREQTTAERAGAAIDEALDSASDRIEEAEDIREEALDEL